MGFFGSIFFFNSFPAGGPLLQQWDEREREKEEDGKIRALKGKIKGHREVTGSLLSKARLAFQGAAVFKEIGFQLRVCHSCCFGVQDTGSDYCICSGSDANGGSEK